MTQRTILRLFPAGSRTRLHLTALIPTESGLCLARLLDELSELTAREVCVVLSADAPASFYEAWAERLLRACRVDTEIRFSLSSARASRHDQP